MSEQTGSGAADKALADALELENNRFMRFVTEAQAEVQQEVDALKRSLAARGLAVSGGRYTGELEIQFRQTRGVIGKMIALRTELGRRVPQLLERPQSEALRDRLDHHLDSLGSVVMDRFSRSPDLGAALRQALQRNVDQEVAALKGNLGSDLAALGFEAQLGFHKQGTPTMTFNISNNTIANLNLGTVVGDLTATVQTLSNQGQADLAGAIRALAEGIASSSEIPDEQKKGLMEHLSFISSETSLPAERRKLSPLKTSISVLQGALGTVALLASMWKDVEQTLKAVGVVK